MGKLVTEASRTSIPPGVGTTREGASGSVPRVTEARVSVPRREAPPERRDVTADDESWGSARYALPVCEMRTAQGRESAAARRALEDVCDADARRKPVQQAGVT